MATNPTFVPATPPNPPSNLKQPDLTPPVAGKTSVHGAPPTRESILLDNAESQAQGENQYWAWLWKTNPKEVWKTDPARAAKYEANQVATDAARTVTPNSKDAESLGSLIVPKPEETAVKEGIIAPEPEFDVDMPWNKTGADLGPLYHGGKVKVGDVNPEKLGQRDAGFFGKGFYLTTNPDFAKAYGNVVSPKVLAPDAKVLDVNTIHPQYEQKVHPRLQKEIESSERAYLSTLPKAKTNPKLVDNYLNLIDPKSKAFDLHSWIDAVNRYAEQKGYDAIRFSNGEVVVKNFAALSPTPKSKTAIKNVSDIPGAVPVNEKRYAWRGAGPNEEEISGAPHDQASESMQEVRDYARRKNGKVQRIDLHMLPKDSYEVSGGVGTPNLYRFKKPVPKKAIEDIESFHSRNKIVPPEKTTGEYDTPIKNGGAVPAGIMRKFGKMEHDLVLFHDPQTGSTLALPADKITPGNVQQHLIESRAKFASGAKSKEISNLPNTIRTK